MSNCTNQPYCQRIPDEQYIKYLQSPITFPVLDIDMTKLDTVEYNQRITGGIVSYSNNKYACYNPKTGVITIHRPGIYRLIASAYVITSNVSNPPRTSLIDISDNCTVTDEPIVTLDPYSMRYFVSGDVLLFANECDTRFIIKNISDTFDIIGFTTIDKIK